MLRFLSRHRPWHTRARTMAEVGCPVPVIAGRLQAAGHAVRLRAVRSAVGSYVANALVGTPKEWMVWDDCRRSGMTVEGLAYAFALPAETIRERLVEVGALPSAEDEAVALERLGHERLDGIRKEHVFDCSVVLEIAPGGKLLNTGSSPAAP